MEGTPGPLQRVYQAPLTDRSAQKFRQRNMGRVELILIRHGQVEQTQNGRYYGGIEVALSETGRAQAQAAAEFLRGLKLEGLWCSPLSRARFGAECVAETTSAGPPQVLEALREIDRGRWVGLHKSELLGAFPGDWEAHQADPESWRDHGGESLGDLDRRVASVWRHLSELEGRHVVVSHLFPTRSLIGRALGLGIRDWRKRAIPTGSVSWLTRDAQGWSLKLSGHEPDGRPFSQGFPQGFPQDLPHSVDPGA